jgi:hypothetical protein
MSHGGVLSRQTFWRDLATSKIFANFTINDDRRKQELQTTQPQNKTVKVGQTLSLDSSFFSRIFPFLGRNTVFRFLHDDES